jgi:hypothetical protein
MTFQDQPEYAVPEGSYHPSADSAMQWLKKFMEDETFMYLMIKESIYSTALSGSELSNYCVGTIERLVVKYGVKVELSMQDDDRTLKVFLQPPKPDGRKT